MVCAAPPLTVYTKVYGAVPFAPVNVISGDGSLIQTDAVGPIEAVGKGLTVIVTGALLLALEVQVAALPSCTDTKEYTKDPDIFVGAEYVIVSPVTVVIVCGIPPLTVYVKVYGATPEPPVKIIGVAEFWQTEDEPLIFAVGSGLTYTVTLLFVLLLQVAEPASPIPVKAYVKDPATFVGTGSVTLFPTLVFIV